MNNMIEHPSYVHFLAAREIVSVTWKKCVHLLLMNDFKNSQNQAVIKFRALYTLPTNGAVVVVVVGK